MTPTEQLATRAIRHVLNRIHTDPYIGWYCGYGTQTFGILTEAYASITGHPLGSIQTLFAPINPQNPVPDHSDDSDD